VSVRGEEPGGEEHIQLASPRIQLLLPLILGLPCNRAELR
jgi:hypothetical protein